MTTVLDRVPVDRITAEAKDVDLQRVALTAIAGVLYGIGWIAAKVCILLVKGVRVLLRALSWCWVAVKVGWQDARGSKAGQRAAA